jgi:DNA-binding NtrC family response regulator
MTRRDVLLPLPPECRERVAHALLAAVTHTLRALAHADEIGALRDGFRAIVRGLRAERALLARVEAGRQVTEVLLSQGLSAEQVRALQSGASSPGLSPTLVRRALQSERVQVIEDARLLSRRGHHTGAFASGDYSVACTAVRDPLTQAPLAVLYLQTSSLTDSLTRRLAPYVDAYALALGHAWKLWDRSQPLAASRAERVVGGPDLVGDSASTRALRERVERIVLPAMAAERPDPILILGETGTGKDVLARYLHARSVRAQAPFIAVNCGTLTGDLVQTTLFGHKRGSFTGAVDHQTGDFVNADRGVLFLDELGELPAPAQVSLLRALDTRRVRGLGMSDERTVDLQFIAATNKDLLAEVEAGRFRPDLFHRLNALTLHLPPLRARTDDVPPLLAHYLKAHERRLGKGTLGLTREVLERLLRHPWPGNVRELGWICSALVLHAQPGQPIDLAVLAEAAPHIVRRETPSRDDETSFTHQTLAEAHDDLERRVLVQVGRESGWKKADMAARLGISRASLYTLLHRHGLKEGHDHDR